MSHSRRIYLINPKFQIKFSLLMSFLVLVAGSIYPYTIYGIMTSLINRNIAINGAASQEYISMRDQLVMMLILLHLGFTTLSFLICIFFSHKIAGPLYKLMKHLRSIRSGEPFSKLFFRKGDYFLEVADEVNKTFEHLDEQYKKDLMYLSEVNSYINNLSLVVPDDKKIVLSEISSKLSEIQSRFTNR